MPKRTFHHFAVITNDRGDAQTFLGFAPVSVLRSLCGPEYHSPEPPVEEAVRENQHGRVLVVGLLGEPGHDWFTERGDGGVTLHLRSDSRCMVPLAGAATSWPTTDDPLPFVAYTEPWPEGAPVTHLVERAEPEGNLPVDHAPHLILARRLAEDSTSPWCGRVRTDAAATPGLRRRVSLGMLATAVRRFLDDAGAAAPVTLERRFELLAAFWRAVQHTFPREWEDQRRHVLSKGLALYALTRLLADLVRETPFHRLSEAGFARRLAALRGRVDWSSRGPLGTARIVDEVYDTLRKLTGGQHDRQTGDDARLIAQERCESEHSPAERNRRGQFATPPELADDIVHHALSLLGDLVPVRFLDPAFGTGAFYDTLIKSVPPGRIAAASGFEVDPVYATPARELWRDTLLRLRVEDFTRAPLPRRGRYNLVVCNPPYVRHHHLPPEEKTRLREVTERASGMRLGGLAGLYCHFVGVAHAWLEHGGLAAWLLPTQFLEANFGEPVRRYLLERVTLLRIHRFDDGEAQFGDAVVTSAVVWFRKTPPTDGASVEFTFGGTLDAPRERRNVAADELRARAKWTRWTTCGRARPDGGKTIGDYFTVKRGLSTGNDRLFILRRAEIDRLGLPIRFFRPILPSPRYLDQDEVLADAEGNPVLEPQRFLLDCRLPELEVRRDHPALWRYLIDGRREAATRSRSNSRTPWFLQEARPTTPFLCTYMGKVGSGDDGPIRFILNRSQATATNSYILLYPKSALQRALDADPHLVEKVWRTLREIPAEDLIAEGRSYGGGLHKLEPGELVNVPFSLDPCFLRRRD